MNKGFKKLLEKYKDIIDSYDREENYDAGHRDLDYWIYLKEGYVCTGTECGTIHEYTIKDCERMLKMVRRRIYD